MERRERIQSIDAIRGFCIILMVAYHFFYDLVFFLGAPNWIFSNQVFDILQPFFAGVFIILSGVSSRFSRSNTRRGVKVVVAALIITLVTWFMGNIVVFGILHLLGVCMIFYGLTGRLWDKIPEKCAPFIYIGLAIIAVLVRGAVNPTQTDIFFVFGFCTRSFYSSDYFPLLPWLFIFLLGTWLGKLVRDKRLPQWVHTVNPPAFPAIGRKSLVIYVLHQPVLYGVTMLIKQLMS